MQSNSALATSRLPRIFTTNTNKTHSRSRPRPKSEILTVHWAEDFLASLDDQNSSEAPGYRNQDGGLASLDDPISNSGAPGFENKDGGLQNGADGYQGFRKRRQRGGRRERPKSDLGTYLY